MEHTTYSNSTLYYERRWDGEVDIRSVKSVMKMDVLRCQSPEMVRKEIWAHLLAYNLLRTVMAIAAAESDTEPRKISFKGAKQAVTAADRRAAEDSRLAPGCHPPRTLGAAGADRSAGTSGAPDATAGRRQTAAESVEILLS